MIEILGMAQIYFSNIVTVTQSLQHTKNLAKTYKKQSYMKKNLIALSNRNMIKVPSFFVLRLSKPTNAK